MFRGIEHSKGIHICLTPCDLSRGLPKGHWDGAGKTRDAERFFSEMGTEEDGSGSLGQAVLTAASVPADECPAGPLATGTISLCGNRWDHICASPSCSLLTGSFQAEGSVTVWSAKHAEMPWAYAWDCSS